MRIIVFGTGKIYARNQEKLSEMNIAAFLDNNPDKQGKYLNGKIIDLPENVGKYNYDYIVIASIHYQEMRKQLMELGVDGRIIIDAEHRGCWAQIRKIRRYDFSSGSADGKQILLITHDLSLTGAPLMLYYAARILRERGYEVTVYSKADGPLRYDYLRNEISVCIFENYDFSGYEVGRYFSGYHMILANTVVLSELVAKLEKTGLPVMWWLHEEDNAYEEYQVKALPQYNQLQVYCVGKRAAASYEKHAGSSNAKELVYGIPREIYESSRQEDYKTYDGKMIYAIIGCVSERKGHDIFVASIKKNWERWKDKAEFWIIGMVTESQRKELEETKIVKVFGSLDHDDLLKIYPEIDVVVCPSRNDPMPVVLAEAMMNRKVCIASDRTGTAEKITPYESGLICQAGKTDSLSEQIDWMLVHRERLEAIGEKAYQIYLREFSQEQFRENLLRIAESMTGEK